MPKKLSKLSAPLGIERDYQKRIRGLLNRVKEIVRKEIVSSLAVIMSEAEAMRPTLDGYRFDDISDKVADLFTATRIGIASEITDYEIAQMTQATALEVSAWNKTQITLVMKQALGIELFQGEPWLAQELKSFSIANANLIKSNNSVFINQVENTVFEGMRRGLRHEEIAKQILGAGKDELGKVSNFKNAKNRANLIGRDQINKLNGKLTELRQINAGVKRYIWRTVGDNRVRDKHAALEGVTMTWEKGGPGGIHPGDEIQCRCYAEPVISDLLIN